ncbi:hypothetical protein [Streptomyces sp. NPDC058548]|uniref:hypothetical protein n=1 Tax=unclassified Streptomyces TaxID=2593676 RepID=UPI0036600290
MLLFASSLLPPDDGQAANAAVDDTSGGVRTIVAEPPGDGHGELRTAIASRRTSDDSPGERQVAIEPVGGVADLPPTAALGRQLATVTFALVAAIAIVLVLCLLIQLRGRLERRRGGCALAGCLPPPLGDAWHLC